MLCAASRGGACEQGHTVGLPGPETRNAKPESANPCDAADAADAPLMHLQVDASKQAQWAKTQEETRRLAEEVREGGREREGEGGKERMGGRGSERGMEERSTVLERACATVSLLLLREVERESGCVYVCEGEKVCVREALPVQRFLSIAMCVLSVTIFCLTLTLTLTLTLNWTLTLRP